MQENLMKLRIISTYIISKLEFDFVQICDILE